jgi:hypothetical protein
MLGGLFKALSVKPDFSRERALEPASQPTSQTASGTAFPQQLGRKIKQTAGDSLYDLSWATSVVPVRPQVQIDVGQSKEE